MAACCTHCAGKGFTETRTERGTTCIDRCQICAGTGGWNEIDTDHGSPLAKAMNAAAARRRAGLVK